MQPGSAPVAGGIDPSSQRRIAVPKPARFPRIRQSPPRFLSLHPRSVGAFLWQTSGSEVRWLVAWSFSLFLLFFLVVLGYRGNHAGRSRRRNSLLAAGLVPWRHGEQRIPTCEESSCRFRSGERRFARLAPKRTMQLGCGCPNLHNRGWRGRKYASPDRRPPPQFAVLQRRPSLPQLRSRSRPTLPPGGFLLRRQGGSLPFPVPVQSCKPQTPFAPGEQTTAIRVSPNRLPGGRCP